MLSVTILSASAKTITCWSCDDVTGSWGSSEIVAMAEGKVNGAASVVQQASGNAAPNIICYSLKNEAVGKEPLDLSAPEVLTEGYLHLYVYISDIDEVILAEGNSVLELSSNGEKCVRWQLYDKVKEGWNELTLKFSEAAIDEGTEMNKISDLRIFQYGYNFTLAVDEITVHLPGEEEPILPPATGSFLLPVILLSAAAGAITLSAARKKAQ